MSPWGYVSYAAGSYTNTVMTDASGASIYYNGNAGGSYVSNGVFMMRGAGGWIYVDIYLPGTYNINGSRYVVTNTPYSAIKQNIHNAQYFIYKMPDGV